MKHELGMTRRACASWVVALVCLSLVSCKPDRNDARTIDLPTIHNLASGQIQFEERHGYIMVTLIDPRQDAHVFVLQHEGVSNEQALQILRKKQEQLAALTDVPSHQQSPPAIMPSLQPATVRITVTNSSEKAHTLHASLADGSVIVNAQVPSCANARPPVWKMFALDKATTRLIVIVDGERKEVDLGKDVKEVVIELRLGGAAIEQHNVFVSWR